MGHRMVDYQETSPVVRHETIRMLLAIAVELDLEVSHLDVPTAFLHGKLEAVFMEAPKGIVIEGETDLMESAWLLNKALYGLKKSSRTGYKKADDLLTEFDFGILKLEPCVYSLKQDSSLVYNALYVDDFLLFCNDQALKGEVIAGLKAAFKIKDLGAIKHCLGLNFHRSENCEMFVDLKEYLNTILEMFGMSDCKPVQTPLDCNVLLPDLDSDFETANVPYRSLTGSLMYLSLIHI